MANEANIKAVITAEDRASPVLASFGERAKKTGLILGATLAAGIGLAAKASFDQVNSVQQATLALRAYEKDGKKVSTVLTDLIKYARSDLGVLFNRKDLFQSAQNLKLYGDNTANLTEHVKILSRSVGLGLSTWEGLNNVIGRVGSTGKLYADDLQYLQNAGFKLDKGLSGSTQTFESLFKLLNKGIPADALAGQANTIKGLGIRLQTAFRGIGDAILGVDSNTSQFIKGGLGDRFTTAMASATKLLQNMKQPVADLSNAVVFLLGKFAILFDFIGKHQSILAATAGIIGGLLVTSFVAWAIAATSAAVATIAATAPIILIGAAVGIAAFLIIKHWQTIKNAFFDGKNFIVNTWQSVYNFFASIPKTISKALSSVTNAIINPFKSAFKWVTDKANDVINAVNNVKNAASNVVNAPKNIGSSLLKKIGFADGGFTGRGGVNEVAGTVHKGEFVLPQNMVDQNTGMPKISQNQATVNININVGALMGNDVEARKFAKIIQGHISAMQNSKGALA